MAPKLWLCSTRQKWPPVLPVRASAWLTGAGGNSATSSLLPSTYIWSFDIILDVSVSSEGSRKYTLAACIAKRDLFIVHSKQGVNFANVLLGATKLSIDQSQNELAAESLPKKNPQQILLIQDKK